MPILKFFLAMGKKKMIIQLRQATIAIDVKPHVFCRNTPYERAVFKLYFSGTEN